MANVPSTTENRIDLLFAQFPILRQVDAPTLGMLGQAERIKAPSDTFLFGVGDRCSSFLLLLEGKIRVYISSDEGREMSLYRIEPGQTCLLTTSCLMGSSPYPAIGRTETDVHGLAIESDTFYKLLASSAEFRNLVFQDFGGRLSVIIQLTHEVAFNKLDIRLADFLATTDLAKITHHQIAMELGTVREIVSRLLKQFQEEGVVKLHRNRIEITDHVKLAKKKHTDVFSTVSSQKKSSCVTQAGCFLLAAV